MKETHVPVLIVGGGPVGLTMSLFLAHHDIHSMIVERHVGTSIHPRARGVNVRSMELLRLVGLEGPIRQAGSALGGNTYFLVMETLAGKELRRFGREALITRQTDLTQVSPTRYYMCAQDELEPVLLNAVREHGSEVHFNHQLVAFEQDASGVTAQVRERTTGDEQVIHADYMIAADGAHSFVRSQLHLSTTGRGTLGYYINIYFRADLGDFSRDRPFILCFITNPEVQGVLLAINNTNRWILNVGYAPEKGETVEDFTPERCQELVSKAIGRDDIVPEIISILPWEGAIRVAERFQQQRIFLVGDAAHTMPPTGAFGMNTGIHDAHNLAWKLAAVLHNQATPDLLKTYDAERRPVADFTTKQAGLRWENNTYADGQNMAEGMVEDIVVALGYRYHSAAILEEGQPAHLSRTLELRGEPGTRAPHLWVEWQGKRISLLDLFDTHFVLLTGPEGIEWYNAAKGLVPHGLPLDAYRVGSTGDLIDSEGTWASLYGVTPAGAVLIRPDGFVAWRTERAAEDEQQAGEALEKVLGQLLGQPVVL